MKKLIYLMGMFLLFSTPTLVHAETDFSQASDEEMLQELNERFAEEKASVSVQEPEAKQEETESSNESIEPFDSLSYGHTVDEMSYSRVTRLIDTYFEKESLTKNEKEKLLILEDKYDEYEKKEDILLYVVMGILSVFTIIVLSIIFFG